MSAIEYRGFYIWPTRDGSGYYAEVMNGKGAEVFCDLDCSYFTEAEAIGAARRWIDYTLSLVSSIGGQLCFS